MSNNYFLVVFDENDQLIEKIAVTHQNDKQVMRETKKKYQGKNYTYKLGNMCTPEQYEEIKALLLDLEEKYPGMTEVYEKDRPEFQHLGYNMLQKNRRKPKQRDRKKRKGSSDGRGLLQ